MDESYWHRRWREGQIGFHADAPNPWLVAHVGALERGARRVLVPLCGKSIDLAFLAAHGFEVVGVELVAEAAEAFFAESGLSVTRARRGDAVSLQGHGIEIVVADFLALAPDALGSFDAFYDRAALIALPEAMREHYAVALTRMLRAEATGLVVTLEHAGPSDEPPFSVPPAEVAALYRGWRVTSLGTRARAGGQEHALLVDRV